MDNRKGVLITLLIVSLVGLAVIVAVIAFRLGQQTVAANIGEASKFTTTSGSPSPSPTIQPPPIITNTPTATPTPTSTIGPTATPTPAPTNTPTLTPTPIVVITHIRALGRLETTEFAMRTVINLENDPTNLWEQIVGTDQLLLIVEGEVVAGFDLNKVSQQDIVVQGRLVKITLPPPEVLYSRIDNQRTYVYERRTGLLIKPDQTLESRARALAEQALIDWATQRDIHKKAESAGRVQIENLLRSLGFTEINIAVKGKEL